MLFVMNNNPSEPKFEQVCVWPFTICPPEESPAFEQYFSEKFGVRIKYIGENKVEGKQIDTLFYIASEDIPKFAVPRFGIGIRWLEDVVANEAERGGYPLPEGVKTTW
jgi:hypothetical protein